MFEIMAGMQKKMHKHTLRHYTYIITTIPVKVKKLLKFVNGYFGGA